MALCGYCWGEIDHDLWENPQICALCYCRKMTYIRNQYEHNVFRGAWSGVKRKRARYAHSQLKRMKCLGCGSPLSMDGVNENAKARLVTVRCTGDVCSCWYHALIDTRFNILQVYPSGDWITAGEDFDEIPF